MILYSKEEGFIKPRGIHFKEEQDVNIKLPEVAIGVFSRHLFEDIVQKFSCKEVGYISCANLERNIYILKYKEKEFTFFMAGVSGPWISGDLEELHACGVKKFIIFGNCGVLDNTINDCSIIIPRKAFRDEGTSYHYLPEGDSVLLNKKYVPEFKEVLKEFDFDYREGYTWTTDAFYRETREKIQYFKSKGAVCVEMEGATIGAVSEKLGIDAFTFYYAGDNLDATQWDERSLKGLVNFDKKKKVALLAFELALRI